MLNRRLLSFIILSVSSLLTSCAVGPDYHRPALETNTSWNKTQNSTVQTNTLTWFHRFQDPTLDALLQEAVEHNQDLKIASERMIEALGNADVSRSDYFPSLDGVASAARKDNSQNNDFNNIQQATPSNQIQMGLVASYEIDLWGKIRRANERTRAQLLGQTANQDAVRLTLYSQVAQNYFSLRALDEAVTLSQHIVSTRENNLRLQQKLLDAGLIQQQQLTQAKNELTHAQVQQQQILQTRSAREANLALLLGRPPAAIAQPNIARGKSITAIYLKLKIPANLSADLLNRRPDIMAAEQNLIAVNADIGATKAAVFPSLTLTSNAGYESQALRNLIDPTSLFWNVGASIAQPIFHYGALSGKIKAATARKNQAQAQYVQAVQNAFRDVHDGLNQWAAQDKITKAYQQQFSAQQNSQRLAQLRYRSGYSSEIEWLNAQYNTDQMQLTLIQAQNDQLTAGVSLYKAMGGSWEN